MCIRDRRDTGRVNYVAVRDQQALETVQLVARTEGILPALESSHALAYAMERARQRKPDEIIVVCLSGRGDKDVNEVARLTGQDL